MVVLLCSKISDHMGKKHQFGQRLVKFGQITTLVFLLVYAPICRSRCVVSIYIHFLRIVHL